MRKILCKAMAVVALLYGLGSIAPSVRASTTCDTRYTFSSSQNSFNLCISNDGNLVGVESPAGFEHIGVGTIGEGYALCSGPSQVYAYDAGFDESGWGPSTVTHAPGGQPFPIGVSRTTLDGSFQLDQTIAINANKSGQSPEREITFMMKLTNLTASTINNVYVTRYAYFKMDGAGGDDIYSLSRDTVSANQGSQASPGVWADSPSGHGMMLTGLNFVLLRSVEINNVADWLNTGHKVCATGASLTAPTPGGDYVGRVALHLGNLAAGASKTVEFVYRRF
jgi:hypothetical protein